MITFITVHKTEIVVCLFAVSECLALIPSVKANSIFQLIFGVISKEKAKEESAPIEEKKAA